VGVTSTRTPFPAIVITPTVFSGFDCTHPTTRSNQIRNLRNPNPHETAKVRSIGSVDGETGGGYLGLGAADEVDGIGLRLEPRRGVVAVPHPLRVVYADHRRLQGESETTVRKLVGDRSSRTEKQQQGACRTSSTMAPPLGSRRRCQGRVCAGLRSKIETLLGVILEGTSGAFVPLFGVGGYGSRLDSESEPQYYSSPTWPALLAAVGSRICDSG
jgi:hypothetical protein